MGLYTLFAVFILIVSLLLVLVIMIQNPKGGGLSSSFGGNQMIGGVQKTNDFLDKTTWTLVILMAVLILGANFVIPRGDSDAKSALTDKIEDVQLPQSVPSIGEDSVTQDKDANQAEK